MRRIFRDILFFASCFCFEVSTALFL
jgi:hypothetical protein